MQTILADFIEIPQHIIHVIFTQNAINSWIFFFSLVFICLPLGFCVASYFFREQNFIRLIVISVLVGITLTFGFWSILVLFHIPFNGLLFISLNIVLPTLIIAYNFKRNNINLILSFNKIEPILFVVSFLLLFYVLARYFETYVTPPDVDSQLHGHLQVLTQQTGNYLNVSPFLTGVNIINSYPPGYHLMNVAISDLTGIPIIKTLISSGIVYFSLIGISLFTLLLIITENFAISFTSVVLFLSRDTLWVVNDSQFSELAAMLVTCVFIILFWKALQERGFKHALLAGFAFGVTGLVHSRFFLWLGIGITGFFITMPLSADKADRKDYKILLITLFTGIFTILPWLLNKISILTPDPGKLTTHGLYHWADIPAKVYGIPLTIFVIAGLAVLFYRRHKIEVFFATWLLALVGFIHYWRFLKLFSPSWFKVDLSTPGSYLSSGQFTDIFAFFDPPVLAWYGLILILTIVAAYSLKPIGFILHGKSNKFYNAAFIFIYIGFSLSYIYNERRHATINWPLINGSHSDYAALVWLKNNTTFDNTLILNIGRPARYNYKFMHRLTRESSRWTSIISERKSIFFSKGMVFDTSAVRRTQDLFDNIYFYLDNSENYKYLKHFKISHVFLPAFFYDKKEVFDRSDYLEQIYQVDNACIYKVVHHTRIIREL